MVFILSSKTITIMVTTRKFGIGTVITRLTHKELLKNMVIIEFTECHMERPLIIDEIWVILLAWPMLQGSIERAQGTAGNQRMHKEKEKERLKSLCICQGLAIAVDHHHT